MKSRMRFCGVIPARYGSKRLEGKVLLDICGKPMIQWVYERAIRSKYLDKVIIAMDDSRIGAAVSSFDGEMMMTSPSHGCGTDRVAEVAARVDADFFINIQADEPLIEPENIDKVAEPFLDNRDIDMTTLCTLIKEAEEVFDVHVVKVLRNRENLAVYFSRAPLPFPWSAPSREEFPGLWSEREEMQGCYQRHVGLYGYRKDVLLALGNSEPSSAEILEGLEQLRAVEAGHRILVIETDSSSIGVDTLKDLERVRKVLSRWQGEASFRV